MGINNKKIPSDTVRSTFLKNFVTDWKYSSILIISICTLCYYNSCSCGFVFDDISAIKDNKDIRLHTPIRNIFLNDFWGTPIKREQSHKSYRPITVLTFRLNYFLHKLEPFGYHLFNVILHCLVCLIYKQITRIFLQENISFLATVLFAVHPIHTEAVTGVVGRAEILSSIFYLLAFYFYYKIAKRNWLFGLPFTICLALAMYSKEQGITVSGICCIYEIFIIQNLQLKGLINKKCNSRLLRIKINTILSILWNNGFLKRIIFLIIITINLLFSRFYVMGSQLPTFTRFDNPASVELTPARQLTLNYLIFLNIWLLIFPSDLCCDWTMGTVPIIKSFADIRNIATLITYFTFLLSIYMLYKCKSNANFNGLIMGLSWFILPFLPASNLFFYVGFVIAERILYMPSMGYCIIIAQGYFMLEHKTKGIYLKTLIILLLLCHGVKTFNRNLDWQTEYTIFTSGLQKTQNNAKLFNNIGHALENDGKHLDALSYFQKAVEIQNDDIGAYINVGRAYKNLKDYVMAEKYYSLAKSLFPKAKSGETYHTRIPPNYLNVFTNLASLISMNETRLEEADFLYRQAINMRTDYVQAYINRGDILMKLNKSQEALNVYKTALNYDNDNPDIYYNIGVVLLQHGKTDEAIKSFEKSLEINPEHEQALLNSAILLQESGKSEAIETVRLRLEKLLYMNDSNDRVLFNLGMLAMDEKDNDKAIMFFKRCVEINPSFKSALFNLSLLLVDVQRALEALPYLKQLLEYHENHIKALILLGDIYMNYLKDIDQAELCYKRIIKIDPQNIQGLHNLCVVYVERNYLKEALICLENVSKMAPKEEYIRKHLNIVRSKLQQLKSVKQGK